MALSNATKAFTEALGLTPQVEWVGLVSYASDYTNFGVQNHRVDIDQGLTENHALIDSAMDTITARIFNGATDIAAGIDSGTSVLLDPNHSRPFAVKTLILMSDGHSDGLEAILLCLLITPRNTILQFTRSRLERRIST